MANSKEIKDQIASIGNTQKITSAMEKVAVSKMKKTQEIGWQKYEDVLEWHLPRRIPFSGSRCRFEGYGFSAHLGV